MKVLVTGADGFIGSHLVEELVDQGHEVRAFVMYNARNQWGWVDDIDERRMKGVEVFAADLRDPFAVRRAVAGCKRVFHLGALIAIPYSYRAPHDYAQTNVVGTLNVLQASLEEQVERVIHTSTSEVYGTAEYVPMDERHPLHGQSPYSASKIGADKFAESYHLSFELPVTTVRPFNTYGPRQSARAVIPTIIGQCLAGGPIRLGSLHPVRDVTFVADTVAGFVKAAEAPTVAGEVLNLGVGEGASVGELVERIQVLLGTGLPVVSDAQRLRPEKSEVLRLVSDNRKARERIGWAPRVSLDDGLRKTIDWFRRNSSSYKPTIYNL